MEGLYFTNGFGIKDYYNTKIYFLTDNSIFIAIKRPEGQMINFRNFRPSKNRS